MTFQQKIFALVMSAVLLVLIVELVRRRKLAEEYSALWILTGVVIFIMVLWFDLLLWVSKLIGAATPTTTLFIFGIVFLIVINLHYSMKITKLSERVKYLAQRYAIEDAEK